MAGLSHIGLALTIIFVISLVILLSELLFVLWRRRIFHRQALSHHQTTVHGRDPADTNSQSFSDVSSTYCVPFAYSKELLYFYFCMNSSRISRIQPNNSSPPSVTDQSRPDDEELEEVIDVFKLQNIMFGPPRFLFTIKEEEEDKFNHHRDETAANKDYKGSAKLEEYLKAADNVDEESPPTTLSAVLQAAEDEEEIAAESVDNEIAIDMDDNDDDDECCLSPSPPFSTPCESPLYYFTPSASPINPAPSAAFYCDEEHNDFGGPPDCRSFSTN
ncbi:OLC1v1034086C1 [Oldenlandia corymbosa var. corymbosa]|uniref:OLC1v1034086C1 n=1 Tax=Oldenlandia corymbosa var. corymbosa TaxID=529605 RepID=A0AAV1CPW8_OLDCO|nr:OLC1v1034086C1 [Oldenlandia corymbosa var. corymbosa]